ncbi:MAG: type II toxin-antitoxin system VapC family toxin [Legionellaceae bacterium]|nr:type II toxin-antitoxin system VapC family toxin [Legionellaceae bacterium]
MGIIIDTNFFIDVERKNIDLSHLRKFKKHGDTYLAAISVSELLAGVHKAPNLETKLTRSAFVEHIISNVPSIAFDEQVARTYAELFASSLKPKGGNVHDLQIAATAITHGYYILTSNHKDFAKIPGINLLYPS